MDVIFVKDHYYIYEHIQRVIWKKSNDKAQSTRWLTIPGCGLPGRTLKSALGGELIVINNEKSSITFVELLSNGEAGDIKEESIGEGNQLKDFIIFGEKDDHLAVLTVDKQIFTLKFELEEDHIKIERQNLVELGGFEDRDDQGYSLTACPRSEYLAVSLVDEHTMASSIEIYDLRNEDLVFKTRLDIKEAGLFAFPAFEFYCYNQTELILTGITKASPSAQILTFYYNTTTSVLREALPRKPISCGNVYKFARVSQKAEGTELHITDENGKLFNVYYE